MTTPDAAFIDDFEFWLSTKGYLLGKVGPNDQAPGPYAIRGNNHARWLKDDLTVEEMRRMRAHQVPLPNKIVDPPPVPYDS